MVYQRIIPVLLVKDNVLVKSVNFKSHKYVGDPINAVKIFNEKEVDELIILDLDASKHNGEPNYNLLKSLTRECFMPLTYGGGVNTLNDVERIFSIGVEKVSLNQAVLNNAPFIEEAINTFGAQSISAIVNIKKDFFGNYCLFDYKKKKKKRIDLHKYTKELEDKGFGEILYYDVDGDGTFKGINQDLLKSLMKSTSIPVVFCGGAASHEELISVLKDNRNLSGIAAGSVFIYHGKHNAVLINYPQNKDRYNDNNLY